MYVYDMYDILQKYSIVANTLTRIQGSYYIYYIKIANSFRECKIQLTLRGKFVIRTLDPVSL